MSVTLDSFNKYDINPRNVGGKFTSDEVSANNAAFTKTFIEADRNVQLEILKKMTPEAKQRLFESLKKHYACAGDQRSKERSEQALIITGADMINSQPGSNFRDISINVMRFMGNNLDYISGAIDSVKENGTKPPTSRDACEFSVGEVLLEGNYNGCVEAAKVFQALFNEAAAQKGSSARAEYVSAFDTDYTDPAYISSHKDQPGHALVEIRLGNETFLMDTSRCDDGSFRMSERPTFDELEKRMIINHQDANNEYSIPTNEGIKKLHIFNRGMIFKTETEATAATKSAAKDHYLKRK
jgi:hypothetical protein